MSDVSLKPSYLHRFWSKKCMSHFCRETTNKNDQFSKWETWIFNAILDQAKLSRVLLWIRIEIMSAVTLYLSNDSILIKLRCRLVNFEKMKKEIYKMIFKKRWWSFKNTASKIKNPWIFFNKLFQYVFIWNTIQYAML